MPPADAVRAIEDLASSTAFEQTFLHTGQPFRGGRDISVPVTVAFGERDFILPRRSRCRSEVPAHTRWIEKRGWGHVPLWVDPLGVSQLILEGTAKGLGASSAAQLRPSTRTAVRAYRAT